MKVTLNQIAYVIKALNLNNTQRSILINAFVNITGGNIEEMEEKLDTLDKEMGNVKNQLDKIDITTVIQELEIGNSDEVKARNLKKLKKVEHTFLADIDYGYGTADWLPASGGQAIITTAAGGQVYYSISKDGAVSKIAENSSQILLDFKTGDNEVSNELKEAIINSKTVLIDDPDDLCLGQVIVLNSYEEGGHFIGYNLNDGNQYILYLKGDTNIFKLSKSSFDGTINAFGLLNVNTLKEKLALDNAYIITPKDESFKTTGLLTFDYNTCGAADFDIDDFCLTGNKSKLIILYNGDGYTKLNVTSFTSDSNTQTVWMNVIVTTTNGDNYLNTIIMEYGSISCTAKLIKNNIATKTEPGVVKACTNIADVTDTANLMGAFNNLLKQMRAAGMMIS
nr:MAG TPA: Head fiber protein [Crassvirales sp.]